MNLKSHTLCFLFLLFSLDCAYTWGETPHNRSLGYFGEAGGLGSRFTPFYLRSLTHGKVASDTYAYATLGLYTPFKDDSKNWDFSALAQISGALGKDNDRFFIEQLYGSVKWKKLALDLGLKEDDIILDGLSSTGGDILCSGNARALPGINLRTTDFIKLSRKFSFRASYGGYVMNDHCFTGKRTRLHHKMAELRYSPTSRFNLGIGINHYAQWGGKDPEGNKYPASFGDYLRIVICGHGQDNAPAGEQKNVLGNHFGTIFFNFGYNADSWLAKFYYQHLFDDGSGLKFQNHFDGLYGLYFSRKAGAKWFKSALVEFYYTKNMSGPSHNDPETGKIVGGNDNYLNNYVYRSGWTFHGQSIGSPFFTPFEKDENGYCLGIANNRFTAIHFGVCGELPAEIEYRILASHSANFGQGRTSPFTDDEGNALCLKQLSILAEVSAPRNLLPIRVSLSIGYDTGSYLRKDNFGIMLKLSRRGWLKR